MLTAAACSGEVASSESESLVDDASAPSTSEAAPACPDAVCWVGPKLGVACDPCVADVCAADPYCCEQEWDGACVNGAELACGRACGTGCGTLDYVGACSNGVLSWCERGVQTQDCRLEGLGCGFAPEHGLFVCA
jgi:hypothetical protein